MSTNETSIFAEVFNSTQSLIALYKAAERRFIQVNKFGLNMFEMRDTNEFIARFQNGQIWPEPPPDISAYLSEIESNVYVQGYLERETLYQTATGKFFWGLLRIDSLEIQGEKHLLVKITNIDSLKKVAVASVQNTQQLQALFNNLTMGIVVTDAEGRIININPFAEQQFGYAKDDLLQRPVEVLLPENYRQKHVLDRTHFRDSPQHRIMGAGRDLYAKRKDGSEFPVEISLSDYQIDHTYYFIAFIVDITIRKNSEVALLKQKDALEHVSEQVRALNLELERKVEARTKMLKETLTELEKSKEELRTALEKEIELGELKSRFVTMASHEFRTPLSTILTSSYILQQYTAAEDQEKRNKHLHKIQNAVQNLTFILEDFLSLEKLEEGQVQVRLQEVTEADLISEIENTTDEMKNILKQGQNIISNYETIPNITTDKKLLHNILVNLVSNAIKYSPEGTTITIGAFAERGFLKVAVTDEGIGIPERDQKHLFERFFRASNAGPIQGTGLGLHIVGRYLQLIKGNIEMKSEVDKGTTFTILLNTSIKA